MKFTEPGDAPEDAHVEVDASMTARASHDIAVAARQRVLSPMTHLSLWRGPGLDHAAPAAPAAQ